MAGRSNTTLKKRQKEMARAEKQREKFTKRLEKKKEPGGLPEIEELGVDTPEEESPDLIFRPNPALSW